MSRLPICTASAAGALLATFALAPAALAQPCAPCPGGGTPEGEPCLMNGQLDVTNAGCNNSVPVFTATGPAYPQVFCGLASTLDSDGDGVDDSRDTDWYLITQAQLDAADADGDGWVQVLSELDSEFPGVTFIIDIDDVGGALCSATTVLETGSSPQNCGAGIIPAKATLEIADHPNGIVVFVSTGNADGSGIFDGFNCTTGNNNYALTISVFDAPTACGAAGTGDCVTPTPGVPGCSDEVCCKLVCDQDDFCCDVEWDENCVDAAQACFPAFLRSCEDDPNPLAPPVAAVQALDDSFFTANTTDLGTAFSVADSIDPSQSPLAGDPVAARWWGLSIVFDDEGGAFIASCTVDLLTPFQVSFFADNGVPGDFLFGAALPGSPASTVPLIFDTGIPFAFTTILEYTGVFAGINNGAGTAAWFQVAREEGESEPDAGGTDPCLFLWVNTLSGFYGEEARQNGAAVPQVAWDFTWCIVTAAACPWDCELVPNGVVGTSDLLALLAQWGNAGSCDFDGGGVGTSDLLKLLANWGDCP